MIFCSNIDYPTVAHCKRQYPTVTKWRKVNGGWRGFYTMTDYYIWKQQK